MAQNNTRIDTFKQSLALKNNPQYKRLDLARNFIRAGGRVNAVRSGKNLQQFACVRER